MNSLETVNQTVAKVPATISPVSHVSSIAASFCDENVVEVESAFNNAQSASGTVSNYGEAASGTTEPTSGTSEPKEDEHKDHKEDAEAKSTSSAAAPVSSCSSVTGGISTSSSTAGVTRRYRHDPYATAAVPASNATGATGGFVNGSVSSSLSNSCDTSLTQPGMAPPIPSHVGYPLPLQNPTSIPSSQSPTNSQINNSATMSSGHHSSSFSAVSNGTPVFSPCDTSVLQGQSFGYQPFPAGAQHGSFTSLPNVSSVLPVSTNQMVTSHSGSDRHYKSSLSFSGGHGHGYSSNGYHNHHANPQQLVNQVLYYKGGLCDLAATQNGRQLLISALKLQDTEIHQLVFDELVPALVVWSDEINTPAQQEDSEERKEADVKKQIASSLGCDVQACHVYRTLLQQIGVQHLQQFVNYLIYDDYNHFYDQHHERVPANEEETGEESSAETEDITECYYKRYSKFYTSNPDAVLLLSTHSQHSRRILQTLFERLNMSHGRERTRLETRQVTNLLRPVLDIVIDRSLTLAQHQQGCITIMRLVENLIHIPAVPALALATASPSPSPSSVIDAILDGTTALNFFQYRLLLLLESNLTVLTTDSYGNYVVQALIHHYPKAIISKVLGYYYNNDAVARPSHQQSNDAFWVALSCNKFGSNVMEKFIQIVDSPSDADIPNEANGHGEADERSYFRTRNYREALLSVIIYSGGTNADDEIQEVKMKAKDTEQLKETKDTSKISGLQIMLHDNFGNFVLQAVIESCSDAREFEKIVNSMWPNVSASPFGHKIELKLKNKRYQLGLPPASFPFHQQNQTNMYSHHSTGASMLDMNALPMQQQHLLHRGHHNSNRENASTDGIRNQNNNRRHGTNLSPVNHNDQNIQQSSGRNRTKASTRAQYGTQLDASCDNQSHFKQFHQQRSTHCQHQSQHHGYYDDVSVMMQYGSFQQ